MKTIVFEGTEEQIKNLLLLIEHGDNDLPKIKTNDDTRDMAIRIVDKLVEMGFVPDCTDTDDETEFEVQDAVHEIINNALNVESDE